jgi:hypothetical protein
MMHQDLDKTLTEGAARPLHFFPQHLRKVVPKRNPLIGS